MMDKQLREFFYDQQDRGHLAFEDSPEYVGLLRQCMALFPTGDLPEPIFDLLETANLISFAHGLRLGLGLREWAGRPAQRADTASRVPTPSPAFRGAPAPAGISPRSCSACPLPGSPAGGSAQN